MPKSTPRLQPQALPNPPPVTKRPPGARRDGTELFAAEQKTDGFANGKISQGETVDGDHGRIGTRKTTIIHDIGWF
jgi:hypothetical protein